MKGLIKYDLMQISSGLKGGFFAVYILFMAVLNVFSDTGNMFSYIIILIGAMMGISAFSYEETYRWNRYTAALPVSTRQIVLARYLVVGIFILGGIAASLLLGAVSVIAGTMSLTLSEWMFEMVQWLLICILYQEIMLPIMYRFGAERGRIVMMLLFILLFAAVYALSTLTHLLEQLVVVYSATLALGVVIIILLPVSVAVSVGIRRKKEF